MSEKQVVDKIRLVLARKHRARTFVNLVGTGWFGKFVSQKNGVVTLLGARRRDVGWGDGSPDLLGWQEFVVTPAMLGKRFAFLLAIEVKVPGRKPDPHQREWLDLLRNAGAICGAATSEQEALKIIESWEEQWRDDLNA
jgi:hypothetical protein